MGCWYMKQYRKDIDHYIGKVSGFNKLILYSTKKRAIIYNSVCLFAQMRQKMHIVLRKDDSN